MSSGEWFGLGWGSGRGPGRREGVRVGFLGLGLRLTHDGLGSGGAGTHPGPVLDISHIVILAEVRRTDSAPPRGGTEHDNASLVTAPSLLWIGGVPSRTSET